MTDYTPPKVWTWDEPSGGQFASINRPTAGATHDSVLSRPLVQRETLAWLRQHL